MDKIKCPSCGREIELQPHPERPWRVVGYCACSHGAVVEMDASVLEREGRERDAKGAKRDSSPLSQNDKEAGNA